MGTQTKIFNVRVNPITLINVVNMLFKSVLKKNFSFKQKKTIWLCNKKENPFKVLHLTQFKLKDLV